MLQNPNTFLANSSYTKPWAIPGIVTLKLSLQNFNNEVGGVAVIRLAKLAISDFDF